MLVRMTMCQFCHNEGHTMRTCNNARLDEFGIVLQQKKTEYTGSVRRFNNWLVGQDTILIRTFVASKCGGIEIENIQDCCDIIIDFVFVRPIYNNRRIDLLVDLLDGLIDPITNSISPLLIQGLATGFIVTVEEPTDDLFQECSICYEDYQTPDSVKLDCGHIFCNGCIVAIAKTQPSVHKCAMCRHEVTQMTTYNLNIKDQIMEHL